MLGTSAESGHLLELHRSIILFVDASIDGEKLFEYTLASRVFGQLNACCRPQHVAKQVNEGGIPDEHEELKVLHKKG